MAISVVTLLASGTTADSTTYATAAITAQAGKLYLLGILSNRNDSTNLAVLTGVTGASQTWSAQATNQYDTGGGARGRMSTYACIPTVTGSGALTITHAETVGGVSYVLLEISGAVDGSLSTALIQSATATNNPVSSLTATLGALGSASNGIFGFVGHSAAEAMTAGSGFTKLGEYINSDTFQIMAEWSTNDTTVDASWTTGTPATIVCWEVRARLTSSLAGAITPTGGLLKTTLKPLAGSITPTGALTAMHTLLLSLAGSITPVGNFAKQLYKTLIVAGTITPVGSLTKFMSKPLGGTITPAGGLLKLMKKPFAGGIVPVGTLTKFMSKPFSGSITPVGTLPHLIKVHRLLTAIAEGVKTLTSLVSRNPTLTQTSDKNPLLTEKDETQG